MFKHSTITSKIGGVGKIVEIDESILQQKYHRGKNLIIKLICVFININPTRRFVSAARLNSSSTSLIFFTRIASLLVI
ncbi:hypothetical protein HZS_772 [Henneguya salminicola]|nr:hypothetical protein HZS_772 [Henneguya salminicola]